MKKLIILLAILIVGESHAQKETFNWLFGYNVGITFNTPGLVPEYIRNRLGSNEGCSSYSDEDGNLILHTDGRYLFNGNQKSLILDSVLSGCPSSSQSSLITAMPGSIKKYYIFTTDSYNNRGKNGLSYSIVDLNMDDEYEKVTVQNIELFSPCSEQLAGVMHGNNKDIWIISHSYTGNRFYAFLLTSNGIIKEPVITEIGYSFNEGGFDCYHPGCLKASPNGKKIAMAICYYANCQLFDFDNKTGKLTNLITLENHCNYGLEFSPDNSHLYTAYTYASPAAIDSSGIPGVFQYDIRSNIKTDIESSKVKVGNQTNATTMQMGPDGKIYISICMKKFLSVINKPNRPGMDCEFENKGFIFDDFNAGRCRYGLPNFIAGLFRPAVYFQPDTLCSGVETEFLAGYDQNIHLFEWDFGDGHTDTGRVVKHIFIEPGDYTVRLRYTYDTTVANPVIDSAVKVVTVLESPEPIIEGKKRFCWGEETTLKTSEDYLSYLWSTGDTTNAITVKHSGTYTVTVEAVNGCTGSAEIEVIEHDLYTPEIEIFGDNPFCEGDSVILRTKKEYVKYNWWHGDTTRSTVVKEAGRYLVDVIDEYGCESREADVEIRTYESPEPVMEIIGRHPFCPGDSVELSVVDDYSAYSWSTGESRKSITVKTEGEYHVEVTDSNGCTGAASETITIYENPAVEIVVLGGIRFCPGDSILLSTNREFDYYYWSTGDTEREIYLKNPEKITLEVKDINGCTAYDTIEVFEYNISFSKLQDMDFGQLIINTNTHDSQTFTNRGDKITIESISLKEGTAFSVVSSPGTPVSLGRDENIDLTVAFAPPVAGTFTDTLLVHIPAPCDTTIRIALTGTGIQPEFLALIRLPDTVATIGDPAYNIPLRARMLSDTTLNLSFTAEISFDATLMLPEEGSTQRTEGGRRFVNLTGGPFALGTVERQIGAVTGSIFLPQNEISGLRIESFAFDKEYVRDSLVHGSIQAEGICEPGLSRIKLIQPELSIYPNPAEGEAFLQLNVPETGIVEISIYDATGKRIIRKKINKDNNTLDLQFGTHKMQSGIYFSRISIGGEIIAETKFIVKK